MPQVEEGEGEDNAKEKEEEEESSNYEADESEDLKILDHCSIRKEKGL